MASAESEQPQQVEQQVSSDEHESKENTEQPIVEQKVEISEPVSASVTNVVPQEQEAKVEVKQSTDSSAVVDEAVPQPEKPVELESPEGEKTLEPAPVSKELTPEAPRDDVKHEEAKPTHEVSSDEHESKENVEQPIVEQKVETSQPTPEISNDEHEPKENTEQPTVEQNVEISQPTPEVSSDEHESKENTEQPTVEQKVEISQPTPEVSSDEHESKVNTEQPTVEQKVEISEPVSSSITNVVPLEQEAKVEVEQSTDSSAVVDEAVPQPEKPVEVESPEGEKTLESGHVSQESAPEAPKKDVKHEEAKPTPEVSSDLHEPKENTEQLIVEQEVEISKPRGEQPEIEGHASEPKDSFEEPVSASSAPAETQQPQEDAATKSEPSMKLDVASTEEVTMPALQNGIPDKTQEAENKQKDEHSADQQEVAKEPQVQSDPSTQEAVESVQN